MINAHDNYWIPSEGYKYLSNGETWTDSIWLGAGADINAWHDTNEEPPEPPEPPEPQEEPDPEEINKSAAYLLDHGMVELPEEEQPDYLNEKEPEPEYFN